MIQTILSGIGLGLGLAIMMGPAFFTLLQTSIDRGFRSALRFAFGIFVSDTFLVCITFLGAASLLGKPMVKEIVGLIGGGVLVGIGGYTFLSRGKGREMKVVEAGMEHADEMEESIEKSIVPKLPKSIVFVVKGFFLNLANPATWFFWIFWVGVVSTQYTDSTTGKLDLISLIIFFSCTLLAVFSTDALKAFVATQLKSRIDDKLLSKVNMIFGIALMTFGVFLIIKSVYPIIHYLPINL